MPILTGTGESKVCCFNDTPTCPQTYSQSHFADLKAFFHSLDPSESFQATLFLFAVAQVSQLAIYKFTSTTPFISQKNFCSVMASQIIIAFLLCVVGGSWLVLSQLVAQRSFLDMVVYAVVFTISTAMSWIVYTPALNITLWLFFNFGPWEYKTIYPWEDGSFHGCCQAGSYFNKAAETGKRGSSLKASRQWPINAQPTVSRSRNNGYQLINSNSYA